MRPDAPAAAAALLLFAPPLDLVAQDCPDLSPGLAVLTGVVQDPELGAVPMPGAEVSVSWVVDGDEEEAEAVVGAEGVYVVCGVPLDAEVAAHATFAGREGATTTRVVDEPVVRLDLTLSLASEGERRPQPFLLGADASGRCPDLMAPSLVRCVDYSACQVVPVGKVRVRAVGEGSGTRSIVDDFIAQARRMGAHGVENISTQWRRDVIRPALVLIEGDAVEFGAAQCRSLVGAPPDGG